MRESIKSGLVAFALSMSLALSAAASTGDAPASAPVDWRHAFWTGFIAVGLWVLAFLLGRLWIRAKSARGKEPTNKGEEAPD
jgi:hypothetical protein